MSNRAFRTGDTSANTLFPRVFGGRGAITAENYLAADTGADVLKAGGNAVDAMVAAVLVEGLTNPQMHTLGGEVPMLIKMVDQREVFAVNGNTAAPLAATPDAYRARGLGDVPDRGILAAGTPATLSALLEVLARFGTWSFNDVAAGALSLAREGFPAPVGLIHQEKFGVNALAEVFRREWPASGALYLPQGRVPAVGEPFLNPALAALLDHLCNIETTATGDREKGLRTVHAGFYQGEPASEIHKFSQERDGFITRGDLEHFETRFETPASLAFRDCMVHKCGPWNQGPVLLQCLSILEAAGLDGLEPNSTDYLHLLIEAIKLAFADREQYYGDPAQIAVPLAGLLSKSYGALRAGLIEPRANPELRPGDPINEAALLPTAQRLGGQAWGPGTVHVDVVDGQGNMVAATPSGAWIMSSEVVPALGFPLGNRLMTFYLEPRNHPNLIAPGKRPRTTISPSLATRDGQAWLAFGSMGGDQQDQWQLQFFLNRMVFGMPLQAAIEAPKLSSEHFPGFFAPHTHFPNRVRIEPDMPPGVLDGLRERGHDLDIAPAWSEGFLLAIERDAQTGVLEAGCDPRGAKGEIFAPAARAW